MHHPELSIHAADFWAGVEAFDKLCKTKTCIAGERGDCNGPVIEAHTIPRSQLEKIAVEGHVYEVRGKPSDLLRSEGKFVVGKRGIGQLSVLNFFCAHHDRTIFSHLEKDELVFDQHQLALLHYRAMGSELYKKINTLAAIEDQIARERARPDKRAKRLIESFQAGQRLGLRDMAITFPLCEEILVNEKYGSAAALVVRFKKPPSIMTVGGFTPEFDYQGRAIQRLGNFHTKYHQVGLSILSAEDQAAVVFTWLKGATICDSFARTFIEQGHRLLTSLAIQTAFEHLENTCMNIPWWDSLRPIEREKLVERMQLAGSSFQGRTGACLQYGGITYDQWAYERHWFTD